MPTSMAFSVKNFARSLMEPAALNASDVAAGSEGGMTGVVLAIASELNVLYNNELRFAGIVKLRPNGALALLSNDLIIEAVFNVVFGSREDLMIGIFICSACLSTLS